jgi:hypothetical protein
MTAAVTQPGGVSVALPFTYSSATAGSFDITQADAEPSSGDQLAFTDSTYITRFTPMLSTAVGTPFPLIYTPPAGLIFVTLTSLAPAASRITASPDFVIGDQIEAAGDASGTTPAPTGLTLNADGTFTFANGTTPVNFWVRAYDSTTFTWGAWALQRPPVQSCSYF